MVEFRGSEENELDHISDLMFPSIAFFAGSVVSGISYYALMHFWILKKYPQKELGIEQDRYSGISGGREWIYDDETNSVKSSI